MTLLLLLEPVDAAPSPAPAIAPKVWQFPVLSGAMTTRHGTTTAATVEEIDVAFDAGRVAVTHYAGTDPLFVRVDGTPPTVGGEDGTFVVLPGTRRVIDRSELDGPTEVRMISAGAVSFELEV